MPGEEIQHFLGFWDSQIQELASGCRPKSARLRHSDRSRQLTEPWPHVEIHMLSVVAAAGLIESRQIEYLPSARTFSKT